ncbi:MAG: AMP-binding protein, partial [Acidimicrobiia bacterium]
MSASTTGAVEGSPVEEGALLWEPSEERRASANVTRYLVWLKETRGLGFSSYEDLWRWSVTDLEAFWGSIWEFCDVRASTAPTTVLRDRRVPGAGWFDGAELNYAEHALRRRDDHPALLSTGEEGPVSRLSHGDIARRVASVATELRRLGVGKGDRVVAYLPNIPEALIAFLATASIGAIWSACSPDFGAVSVVDRFRQIEPTALFAVDGYRYGGKPFDRRPAVAQIR